MKPTKGLLERVASRVLADAAFILAEPLAKEPPAAQAWPATGARIAFSGPWRGFVEIWAPDEVARLLAANILGQEIDDPDIEETLLDAMLETLNVICGNLLAELAGREPMFQLGSPRPCHELVPFSEKDPGVDAWLEAEGHPLLVRMRVLEPEAQAA
jgi:hypothetical protein